MLAVNLWLPFPLHLSLARPFERSTMRSRSFKKINRALSVLRRTKSGSAVANHADQGRENSENTTVPEGKRNPHPSPPDWPQAGFPESLQGCEQPDHNPPSVTSLSQGTALVFNLDWPLCLHKGWNPHLLCHLSTQMRENASDPWTSGASFTHMKIITIVRGWNFLLNHSHHTAVYTVLGWNGKGRGYHEFCTNQ